MAAPRAWADLSDSYRSRLLGAARSGKLTGTKVTGSESRVEAAARKAYEGGATQGGRGTVARGHANPAYVSRPKHAPPTKAVQREALGMGDAKTMADLEAWRAKSARAGGPPAWLRGPETEGMGTDVLAIIAQVDVHPDKWRTVRYSWLPNGGAIVTITPKRGRERSIILPDYGATQEFGRWLHYLRRGSDDPIEVLEPPVNSPTPGKAAA